MKVFLLTALLLLALPISAAAIPCAGAGDITLVGSCSSGGATFDQFVVSSFGVTAAIGLADAPFTEGARLGFHVATNPPVVSDLADILVGYHASAAVFTGVALGNGGNNVWIQEKVCGTAFVGSGCATGLLANYLVGPGEVHNVTIPTTLTEIWVLKDIQFAGPNAFLSDFSNDHALEPVPEPATLLLFGSSLAVLGYWRRRTRS